MCDKIRTCHHLLSAPRRLTAELPYTGNAAFMADLLVSENRPMKQQTERGHSDYFKNESPQGLACCALNWHPTHCADAASTPVRGPEIN